MLEWWPDAMEEQGKPEEPGLRRLVLPILLAIFLGVVIAAIVAVLLPGAVAQARIVCSDGYCTLKQEDLQYFLRRAAICHWPGDD